MKEKQPLSVLELERAALGEVTLDVTDPETARQVEEIKRSNREILEALPPALVAGEVRRRYRALQPPARAFKTWMFVAPLAAAAMAAFLFLTPTSNDHVEQPEYIGMKGTEPHLVIFRKDKKEAEPLTPRSTVAAHDVLQLGYVAAGRAWGAIFSLDANRQVTVHLPITKLDLNGLVPLTEAYELDDAPDFERFFFVTGQQRFDLDEIVRKARELGADGELSTLQTSDVVVSSTLLHKAPR